MQEWGFIVFQIYPIALARIPWKGYVTADLHWQTFLRREYQDRTEIKACVMRVDTCWPTAKCMSGLQKGG